ncbi:hypothetical protein EDC01DRAFT_620613 [Geopyxis carbonaria]|nr:hypothetical protein EDC01DRAFT_620613 [Geopyxis carbonaria]
MDTASEAGDDGASAYGENSIYEDSIFEGHEGESNGGRGTPDLSRRAERILANAKRKLDLCGQNISRARSSLILSPSSTPTSFMDHLNAVGPMSPRMRSGSAEPVMYSQQRWKPEGLRYGGNSAEGGALPGGGVGLGAHLRTSSEGAVLQNGGRSFDGMSMLSDVVEDPREVERPSSEMSRSKSTQQMRALRDQMKDLRGKITNLQAQNKTDSVKRRESFSSLAGGINLNTPSLQDIRESRELDMKRPTIEAPEPETPRDSWATILPRQGTSSPNRASEVCSPFSERHEDRLDAFSYDSLLIGTSFIPSHSIDSFRPTSMSSDTSTATILGALPLERKESIASVSSYETAIEPDDNYTNGLRPAPSPRTDDGYHSTPHTPLAPPPPVDSSWYRESIATLGATVAPALNIGRSTRDSSAMVVGDMELRIGREERYLIEGVIEVLGRICCQMETESAEGRRELRERLRGAMRVLEGEEGEMF